MNDTTVMKVCARCKEEKPITDFHKDNRSKDFHQSKCKTCSKSIYEDTKKHISDRGKIYYKLNRDILCAKTRAWAAANRQRKTEADKAYYEANKEKHNASVRAWKEAHKDVVNLHNRNRRARKEESSGTHTASDIRQILSLQKSKCAACKTKLSSGYHVDHVIALANGGSNDKYNLQILCQPCNNSKHAKDPIDFMQSRGFLL